MSTMYRHTQVGRVTVAAAAIAWLAAVWHLVRGSGPAGLVIAAVLLGIVLLVLSTLTVAVRDGGMEVFFGPRLIRRRIPLRRIRHVRVVRTPWYYGWGIRLTPRGWLWNVSGLDGVEVEFENGDRFRVGSDEPDRLAEALLREMEAAGRDDAHR
jgi:hypothetical protein